MPPGRPRKPVEAHIAAGTHRPDRHGATPTVVAGRGPLKPGKGMTRPVAAVFRELSKLGASILDQADAPIVEAAAVALLRARQATADVETRGMLITVTRTNRSGDSWDEDAPNPSVAIERAAWAEFRLLTDRLGIGPSARARLAGLGVEGKPAAESFDELAEMRRQTTAS